MENQIFTFAVVDNLSFCVDLHD